MDKKEKVYISNILKLIFDKSQESTGKKKLGNHIIEYLESLKVNGKEKEEVEITQLSSQVVNEKVEVKTDGSSKQEMTNNQQHSDTALHSTINGISDFNEKYGCWSKGWKIVVGIYSFLFGLYFLFVTISVPLKWDEFKY